MTNIFAVGDIHGCEKEMNELLRYWNPDSQQLVFLGDYIDRGPESLAVLKRVQALHTQYGAIAIGGNHEELILSFCDTPNEMFRAYVDNGGWSTIKSMIPEDMLNKRGDIIMSYLREEHGELLKFIEGLPDYYECNEHVFVHAGVSPFLKDWKDTQTKDFRWIRDMFHYTPNEHDKNFVFGHTPTRYLNPDQSNDVWVSACGTKIGIDGGIVFGGALHGLAISSDGGYEVHTIGK